MKKFEKNKYQVKPEELPELLSQVNRENGFIIPEHVTIARNNDLRLCLTKLLTISPNVGCTCEIQTSLSKMEGNKDNLPLHLVEFSNAITKYKEASDSIMNICKDTFAIVLTVLKMYQLKNSELSK